MASLEEGRLCLWWGFPGATFSPLTWAAPPASSSGCFHGLPPLAVAPTGGWTGCGPQVLGAGQSPHAPASFLPCSPACSRALPPASPGTPPSPRPSPAAPRVGSVFLLLRSCPGVARAQPENVVPSELWAGPVCPLAAGTPAPTASICRVVGMTCVSFQWNVPGPPRPHALPDSQAGRGSGRVRGPCCALEAQTRIGLVHPGLPAQHLDGREEGPGAQVVTACRAAPPRPASVHGWACTPHGGEGTPEEGPGRLSWVGARPEQEGW